MNTAQCKFETILLITRSKCWAWYTNISYGAQVSAFTGPVALAAEVLNVLPFLPAAACAAGVTLCRRAGDLLKERAAFYVALTSLAVAAYFDCASIWFCCTYTFVQGAPPCAALFIC